MLLLHAQAFDADYPAPQAERAELQRCIEAERRANETRLAEASRADGEVHLPAISVPDTRRRRMRRPRAAYGSRCCVS